MWWIPDRLHDLSIIRIWHAGVSTHRYRYPYVRVTCDFVWLHRIVSKHTYAHTPGHKLCKYRPTMFDGLRVWCARSCLLIRQCITCPNVFRSFKHTHKHTHTQKRTAIRSKRFYAMSSLLRVCACVCWRISHNSHTTREDEDDGEDAHHAHVTILPINIACVRVCVLAHRVHYYYYCIKNAHKQQLGCVCVLCDAAWDARQRSSASAS